MKTEEPAADLFHVQNDAEYRRQSEAEAEFWNRSHLFHLDIKLPVIDPFRCERFTGNPDVPWVERIPTYGTFRNGCVLGTGSSQEIATVLEQNHDLHLTLYDISEESLARREEELGARFPGRIRTVQADLNFAELPEEENDLIFSSFCLHHLLNLEHIAYQINRALLPSGYFFHCDYVGEPRFQFAQGKKDLFEALLAVAASHYPQVASWHPAWPDVSTWEHSPFEAIRSDEILGVFRRYLREESVRSGSTLLWLLIWLRQEDDPPAGTSRGLLKRIADRLNRWKELEQPGIREIIEQAGTEIAPVDRVVSDAGLFLPWDALAVYRKRATN